MVEFCTICGTSLPKGDLSFKAGKVYTSPDYSCPSCGKLANPARAEAAPAVEPSSEHDIVFKKGQAASE